MSSYGFVLVQRGLGGHRKMGLDGFRLGHMGSDGDNKSFQFAGKQCGKLRVKPAATVEEGLH